MDNAPLPPHERTWRHPSEIAGVDPTLHDHAGSSGLGIALVGGTLAVLLVAALVVSFTPRSAPGTVAVGATTIPAAADLVPDSQRRAMAAAESLRAGAFTTVRAIPHAVAAVPVVTLSVGADAQRDAVVLPDLDDTVVVLTEDFAYAVAWKDVARVEVATDAVVVADDGTVVARIVDGRIVMNDDMLVSIPADD